MERKKISANRPWEAIVGYSRAVRAGDVVEIEVTAIMGQGAAVADEFNTLAKKYSPKVQQLARKTRAFVKKEMPGAVEQVKLGWSAAWYGTTPKMNDVVVAIHIRDEYVNLEFAQGTSLRDPEKLLEGTGKNMRHVKIRDLKILEKPAFMALAREAISKGPP